MQRLILFRHGKAEAESSSGDDFDRRLTPGGVSACAVMGQRLAAMGLAPDVALVSLAARTRETWAALAESFPAATAVFHRELYLADPNTLRAWGRKAGEGRGVVMIVAHNPGLQDLTVELMRAAGAGGDHILKARTRFPPGTAAVFAFDHPGQPHFQGLYFPERAG